MALRKLRKTLKPIIAVLTFLFIASLLAIGGSGIAGGMGDRNKTALKIDGKKVKVDEIERVFNNAIYQYSQYYGDKIDPEFIKLMMFNGLIEQKVLMEKASEYSVKVTDADVEKEFKEATKDMDKETIKRMLSVQNTTKSKMLKELKESMISKKVREAILDKYVPSNEEIQAYYDANKDTQYSGKAFKDVATKVKDDVKNMNKGRAYKKISEDLIAKSEIKFTKDGEEYKKYMKAPVIEIAGKKISNVVFENMVFMKLMYGAGTKENAVAAAKEEFKKEVALMNAANAKGINKNPAYSEDDQFDYLKEKLAEVLKAEQKFTDADLMAYFNEVKDVNGKKVATKDRYNQNESMDAAIVYMSYKPSDADRAAAKQKAEAVLAEAKEGKDFAELAKKYSQDPGSAQTGGELGWFGKGKMVADFENAAFKGEKGKVYPEIVNTQFGYHIIKVEDKNEAKNEVKAAHILIMVEASDKTKSEIKAKADKIVADAKAGKSMTELAKANSELQNKELFTNIVKGGYIEGVTSAKEVNDALYSLKEKEIKVVDTKEGVYVVQNEKYTPFKAAVFGEIKTKIQNDYLSEKVYGEIDKLQTEGATNLKVVDLLKK